MKTVFNFLFILQTATVMLLNGPQSALAELGHEKEPLTVHAQHASNEETTGINSGKNELASLNKRAVISATVSGAVIGAAPGGFIAAYFITGGVPSMLVGAGSGALMGFTMSCALVKIQPQSAGKGFLLGLGLGSLGGLFSGAAAGLTLFDGDPMFGLGLGCLGGSVTGLLSGAIFCSIYGYKAGKYSSSRNTRGIEATMGLPRIGFYRAPDGRAYARFDANVVTLAF